MKKAILRSRFAVMVIAILLISTLLALTVAFAAEATTLTATPTSSTVLADGKSIGFDAYNIDGNNYFKLRDIAYVLNGTGKQFDVSWDGANNAISLTSNKPYTVTGGEMTGKGSGTKTPKLTSSKILLNGKEVTFTAYNIDGNNYFKLRDIGKAFNFGVTWDGAKNTIVIDTSVSYAEESAPVATDDSRLEPLLITTRSVMELVSQYQSGLKPKNSGNVSVAYYQNGTIMSCSNIFSLILFDYSQPKIMSYEYILDTKLKKPSYDNLRNYRQQLSDGTYDFAGDPGAIGGYFFDNGDAALSDLNSFRNVSNNKAITQEIFDAINGSMSQTHGSNAVILYCRNADGVAYGKYILLNIAGYDRELDAGRPFYNLDPSSASFGKKDSIVLSDY